MEWVTSTCSASKRNDDVINEHKDNECPRDMVKEDWDKGHTEYE